MIRNVIIIYRFSWLDKTKKARINPIDKKDNKCFQYNVTVALNHEEFKEYQQRLIKTKPFINKYNREGKSFPWEKDDRKNLRKLI